MFEAGSVAMHQVFDLHFPSMLSVLSLSLSKSYLQGDE
jgi:hypothetical protein